MVPAVFEVWRARGAATRRDYAALAAAVVGARCSGPARTSCGRSTAPATSSYPLRVQQASASRGGWIDPSARFGAPGTMAADGDHLSAGIHVVTATALVVLIVVCWRRWPASFTAYAIAVAVVGLSARNLDSLERYSLSTVPFVLAGGRLTGGGTRERVVLVALGAVLVACSVLAFSGLLVP